VRVTPVRGEAATSTGSSGNVERYPFV